MADEQDDRQGRRERQPLPGSVSDQNAEEQVPGTDEEHESRRPPGSPSGGDDQSGGESREGSQSTGHPDSAG